MAELAVDFRERGVLGFDLAGEEGGYPPKKHVDAFHTSNAKIFNITVHAGELRKESIWQADPVLPEPPHRGMEQAHRDIAVVNARP